MDKGVKSVPLLRLVSEVECSNMFILPSDMIFISCTHKMFRIFEIKQRWKKGLNVWSFVLIVGDTFLLSNEVYFLSMG
jgi:hypothetical protein